MRRPCTVSQIIEGAFTIFLGLITYLYVPDFPDKNRFLTPEQTAVVLRRIEIDRGDSVPDVLTPAKIWFHLKDWSIWTYGMQKRDAWRWVLADWKC